MKKVIFTLSIFLCLFLVQVKAQNTFPSSGSAGIGTTTPNVSSLMEMASTTKGLLIPRMTQAQRDAIPSPATGLMIYQTNNTAGFYYFNGAAWIPISTKSANTALSNLKSPTAVNMILQPGSNGSIDLGATGFGWKDIYATGSFYIGGRKVLSSPDTTNIFVGKGSGVTNTTGKDNTAIGSKTLYFNTTGSINTATGSRALYYNTTGGGNTANGYRALEANTTGNYNIASGDWALSSNTIGGDNAALGVNALQGNITGSGNIAIGSAAAMGNSTGHSNIAIGITALLYNQYGSNLVAIGDSALYSNTAGYFNTAVGSKTLYTNAGGYQNTATGYHALYLNTSGNNNTATGLAALSYNTTGSENTATGTNALTFNTTGSKNTASGFYSLYNNETGYSNVAIGASALFYNFAGSNLVAVGDSALFNQSGGYGQNTGIGSKALFLNTTGGFNTATGWEALGKNNGSGNSAFGDFSLGSNTSGDYNTGIGDNALYANTTGGYNISVGANTLFSSNGDGNTAVGYHGLNTVTSGSYNTSIGYGADVSAGSLTNATAIGYGALVNASNKAVIGNGNVTVIGGHVGWSILSDGRFKTNIKENVPGLEFINKLKPVTYNIDEVKFAKFTGVKDSLLNVDKDVLSRASQKMRTGFVAQDVERSAQEINYDFDGVNRPQNDKDNYSLVYADFVPSLVKAVQQLSSKYNDKDSMIASQQSQLNAQQKQIDDLKTILLQLQQNFNSCSPCAQKNVSGQQSSTNIQIANDKSGTPGLEQNAPNPFNAITTIKYHLPVNNGNVYINFYSNSGALLKSVKLNGTGNGSITVNARDLSSGSYRYTLLVDSKIIDSKQMIAGK